MKKIFITPLFTLLVVSCGTTLPSFESSVSSLLSSQDESSLISQITSSSSVVSSSSSTSSSSSSTSTSSSTSSTSSQPPLNTRKVPFNQIGSLVAQVVDAKAMGIINNKDRSQVSGRKNAQEEDQNYMVKVTETYNPNTEITEDQTVQVTFSRVTNTQTTELQTGTESYLATAEASEIERLTDLPGNIVITNVEGNEYRLLSEEAVVQDWISSELETLEFIFDGALPGITLESRSLNASISFIAFEGFTYTINQGETIIYEDLEDNDEADNNEALGNITLSGLTEGLTYDVTYEGYQVIETITQDEVEGQVDKLYVLYQYTFISFVPLNLNQRPKDQDLELDYDNVPLYDKQGYFSDSTRQSFVVDNDTGLIYKIENINIASLSGGCVAVQGSPFPHDLKVNENRSIEFFTLNQNASISNYSCIKDRFGNKFIQNSRLNLYDNITNTYYFVFNSNQDSSFSQNIGYWLANSGEVLKVIYTGANTYETRLEGSHSFLKEGSLSSGKGEFRILNELDTLNIYDKGPNGLINPSYISIKVNAGNLIATASHYYGFAVNFFVMAKLSLGSNNDYFYTNYGDNHFLTKFLKNEEILLAVVENKLYYYKNVWLNFDSIFSVSPVIGNHRAIDYSKGSNALFHKNLNPILLLDNVIVEEEFNGNSIGVLTSYSLSGKTTYDLVSEHINGELSITPYISGTYVVPPATSITLQPINR